MFAAWSWCSGACVGCFDYLFQLIRIWEMKSFNYPNNSVSGSEPFSMVYAEVFNKENFSMWVWNQQRLMARSKIPKEGEKVRRIRRALAKAKNDSNSKEIYFKPGNIKARRFKIHEPCNMCVYVAVSTDLLQHNEDKGCRGEIWKGLREDWPDSWVLEKWKASVPPTTV